MIVESLDKQFAVLINSLKELVGKVDAEQLLRSAAVIEQTFGGLTSNLWDDPFEWTLPETLSTPELVIEHLSEVDALRQRLFSSIDGDAALSKLVSVPSGEPCALVELLLETLVRASDYRGRALAAQ
ncbi:MAG TPA: hypothetical protein VJT15_15475 [Pyrinomonadaceae bacterium]|nr:hypothetical protein [Pyrinomonadaceae bacterium]